MTATGRIGKDLSGNAAFQPHPLGRVHRRNVVMVPENRFVTLDETASLLAVSSATVRNWIKHDYLRPADRVPGMLFRYEEVRSLHERIAEGSIPRLARRANKASAKRSFIPEEYLGEKSGRGSVERIVAYIGGAGLDIDRAFFALALSRLCAEGLCGDRDLGRFIKNGFHIPGRSFLGRELRSWHRELGNFRLTEEYNPLFGHDLPRQRDVLGLIYQSLMSEGDKAGSGSYYTPDRIVDDIAATAPGRGARILDPCCGTGQFLLAFAERTGDPFSLYGSDIDGLAVHIARINMMVMFRDIDFDPRIRRSDFLLDRRPSGDGSGGFDMIATNPPWGLHYSPGELARLKELYPDIRSLESFSYMLKKSIDLLRQSGSLSFILPESLLHVKAHRDIRSYILNHARIERIVHLGRVFKNVFTPVIRLDLARRQGPGRCVFVSGKESRAVDQGRFARNGDCVFDVNVGRADERIIGKVFGQKHALLRGAAEWALGIVTGDNGKYLRDTMEDQGYEPIYTGKEVRPYRLGNPSKFIRFMPERFQQAAPEWKYRAEEKLIYRFISRNLVVSYDDRRCLTLNSANVLIPRAECYPVKAVLALFNSSLYQFIFQKKFSSIKVLRGHLEQLPLPLWGGRVLGQLVSLADGVLGETRSPEEVDAFVMEHFRLNAAEMKHIQTSLL
ncbi:MAG TPA: N-6 DNA methylase [Spirochaetota bacterium]|nr:N-6 DNA methylase [Spirochaetota bacterium]